MSELYAVLEIMAYIYGLSILLWPVMYGLLAIAVFLIAFGVPKPLVAIPYYILDIVVNWYQSIFWLDLPKKFDETISKRLERYKKLQGGKRFDLAVRLCELINKLLPKHC